MCKKISKSINKNSLQFPMDMYSNLLGSLVITNFILSEPEVQPNINFIKTQWRKIKKNGLSIWIDNPNFIPEALKIFKLKPHYGYFAMCQSRTNTLFCPYVDNKPYPIREDGVFAPTIKYGKIYPITEENSNVSEQRLEKED